METIRKAKKEYSCYYCDGIIRVGNKYIHHQHKVPIYDDEDIQTGILYLSDRVHIRPNCQGRLKAVPNYKKVLQQCDKGNHEYQEEYVFDHYAGEHKVYAPTGKSYCVNCGEEED